jgi:hypothetical protein
MAFLGPKARHVVYPMAPSPSHLLHQPGLDVSPDQFDMALRLLPIPLLRAVNELSSFLMDTTSTIIRQRQLWENVSNDYLAPARHYLYELYSRNRGLLLIGSSTLTGSLMMVIVKLLTNQDPDVSEEERQRAHIHPLEVGRRS